MSIYETYKLYILKNGKMTDRSKQEILFNVISVAPNKIGPLQTYENDQIYTTYRILNDKKMYLTCTKKHDNGDIGIVITYSANEIGFEHKLFENFLMAF